MTNKEAAEMIRDDNDYLSGTYREALKMAISTLEKEKQIPKKPIVNIDVCNKSLWHLYCPTCGAAVGVYNKRLKKTAMYNSINSMTCDQCEQMFDLELQEGE